MRDVDVDNVAAGARARYFFWAMWPLLPRPRRARFDIGQTRVQWSETSILRVQFCFSLKASYEPCALPAVLLVATTA